MNWVVTLDKPGLGPVSVAPGCPHTDMEVGTLSELPEHVFVCLLCGREKRMLMESAP